MIKNVMQFFDRLQDKVKRKLSHYPIVYAFIGGTAIVLFWRGVWHLADDINLSSIASIAIGFIVLVLVGIFVTEFIGNKLIISDLAGEKKLAAREETEIKTEGTQIKDLQNTLARIEKKISDLEN